MYGGGKGYKKAVHRKHTDQPTGNARKWQMKLDSTAKLDPKAELDSESRSAVSVWGGRCYSTLPIGVTLNAGVEEEAVRPYHTSALSEGNEGRMGPL